MFVIGHRCCYCHRLALVVAAFSTDIIIIDALPIHGLQGPARHERVAAEERRAQKLPMHVWIHVCMSVCMYVRTYVCMYVCLCIYILIYSS